VVVDVVVRTGGRVSSDAVSLLAQATTTVPMATTPMHSSDSRAGVGRHTSVDRTDAALVEGGTRNDCKRAVTPGSAGRECDAGLALQCIAMTETAVTYPGARAPDREWTIDAGGVRIAAHEWGDANGPPVVLAHGGFDFARTYDVFAPLLADAGWRAVSWDQRGHGDSEHTPLYSWEADMRDALAVLDDVGGGTPLPVIGHSKGGSITLHLADAHPYRIRKLVNIDGIPFRQNTPDVADRERTKMLSDEVSAWLDHRRRTVDLQRKPGTIDELARRRARMNPRLELDWLRYLVTVGAREDDDGWRWKIDSSMRFGGFGPWRPQWTLYKLPGLSMPFLSFLATEPEVMGWGTVQDDLAGWMPADCRCEQLPGAGHFIHIEKPREVADIVLEFLGEPG
jgi:pimeloyl-ACP methyl ester carboxylesterase